MTPDATSFVKALTPRTAIHAYLAQIAEQRRRAGLVPMDGQWMTLEERAARLRKAAASSRFILVELFVLFLALTGASLFLLLLNYYLAY
jgi:hypothetical protein